MQVTMPQCYNKRLVLERNSNSKSLTVMFSALVTPSMDEESNRTSRFSLKLAFLEQLSKMISKLHS